MRPGQPAAGTGDPPTLLYLATVPQPIRNFYLPYAAHFRSLGWRLVAAAHGATREPALRETFDEVVDLPVYRSSLDVRNYLQAPLAIRRLLGRSPDIVHVHTPIASFLVRSAARTLPRERRPGVIYTAHGFHFHRDGRPVSNALFRSAERLAGRWTDRLIVINDEDEGAALSAGLVPHEQLVRMAGVGVDTAYYARSAISPKAIEAARKTLAIREGVPLFVIVGELHPNKRHRDVIEALAAMKHPDAVLAILGEGQSRQDLEGLARRLGVTDRVRFLGFVEDVRPYVAAATGLILASRREGLPRAVMEAMALEVPVIVSASRGTVELVGGGCGHVVAIGSVTGFAAAMDRFIDDPGGARDMAARARQSVVDRYDLAFVIARHQELYDEVLLAVAQARNGHSRRFGG